MAMFALFAWPFIAMAIVSARGSVHGLIWATLIGALFLPEKYSIDLPGLPPYDKNAAVALGLVLGLLVARKTTAASGDDPNRFAARTMAALAVMLLVSGVVTVLANPESLTFGPTFIKGLDLHDLMSMTSESMIFLILFLAAQRHLGSPEAHVALLRAFVLAGAGYSLLVLFEVRMSPQLHQWVYGYFQHSWIQHVRGGAYRPIVFQPHGLWIGIFLLTCALSAIALFKTRFRAGDRRGGLLFATFWFVMVLFLSRNFGATVLAVLFAPALWFLGRRPQTWIAVSVVATFLVYPALRQSGLITLDTPIAVAESISPERAQSFAYRVDNERAYLERAAEKPLTGWGIWARWRIFDPVTGADVSVSDGRWVSVLGERGWIGYIASFGLLSVPILLLPLVARRREVSHATMGIAMIMVATMLYQLANNTIGPMTLLLAGALSGFVIRMPVSAVDAAALVAEAGGSARLRPGQMRYSRFGGERKETPAAVRSVPDTPAATRAEPAARTRLASHMRLSRARRS